MGKSKKSESVAESTPVAVERPIAMGDTIYFEAEGGWQMATVQYAPPSHLLVNSALPIAVLAANGDVRTLLPAELKTREEVGDDVVASAEEHAHASARAVAESRLATAREEAARQLQEEHKAAVEAAVAELREKARLEREARDAEEARLAAEREAAAQAEPEPEPEPEPEAPAEGEPAAPAGGEDAAALARAEEEALRTLDTVESEAPPAPEAEPEVATEEEHGDS